MALPKLNSPTYQLELPSTGKKIKYRPFLVKEQKILMMAQESKDEHEVLNAMTSLVNDCTFGKIDATNSPMFDVEYIFLRIRGKSIGEKVQLTMPVTGKDHGSSKIDTFYQGDFLVTQLRHSFDQSERKHIMYISATKDSIPAEFTNVAKSTEPVGGKGLIKTY